MKLITTDIAIEAVVRFMKRNYHKFSRLEILFVELYRACCNCSFCKT